MAQGKPFSLFGLPNELVIAVFDYISLHDLQSIGRVSSYARRFVSLQYPTTIQVYITRSSSVFHWYPVDFDCRFLSSTFAKGYCPRQQTINAISQVWHDFTADAEQKDKDDLRQWLQRSNALYRPLRHTLLNIIIQDSNFITGEGKKDTYFLPGPRLDMPEWTLTGWTRKTLRIWEAWNSWINRGLLSIWAVEYILGRWPEIYSTILFVGYSAVCLLTIMYMLVVEAL